MTCDLLRSEKSSLLDKGGYHRNCAHDGTDTSITRAIRRCGELLKQIESGQGSKNQYTVLHDAADKKQTRSEVAKDAGLSERQKVTALRVANVPQPEFERATIAVCADEAGGR